MEWSPRGIADRGGRRPGAARGRQRGGRRDLRGAHLVRQREPAERLRCGRLHDGPRGRRGQPHRLLRRGGWRGRGGAQGGADPDPRLLRRDAADLQLRRRVLRGAGEPGRTRARPSALRLGPAGEARGARRRTRPQGRAADEGRGVLPRDPPPDPDLDPGVRGALRARGPATGGGGHLPLPGDVGCAGAVCRRGRRAVLPRGYRAACLRLGPRTRRDPGHGRHGRVRANRATAGGGPLSWLRGAHQPAPVLGRDPDRVLPGSPGAPRRPQWRGANRRGDRGRQQPAHGRLPPGPARRGLR